MALKKRTFVSLDILPLPFFFVCVVCVFEEEVGCCEVSWITSIYLRSINILQQRLDFHLATWSFILDPCLMFPYNSIYVAVFQFKGPS